jgi:hypothetical protein
MQLTEPDFVITILNGLRRDKQPVNASAGKNIIVNSWRKLRIVISR